MPYKVAESNGRITLTSTLNPYVEVMGAFGFKKGCSYFKVLTKRDQDFINLVIKEAKADKKFNAKLTKAISEGDKVNQIEISKK
jgi:succinate dehydrogenase flavin-adding protein (antitoxin of CptAB toxin-antitoxin module)